MAVAVCCFPTVAVAQILYRETHVPLSTDSLVIYKQPYQDITDDGTDCVWDFSKTITDTVVSYVDFFNNKTDTLSFGVHRCGANSYRKTVQDTLFDLGYETSHTYIRYSKPEKLFKFPFAYKDSVVSSFSGKGEYCHLMPLYVEGTSIVKADAQGRLILPDMTIDSVLRVHTQRRYHETGRVKSQVVVDMYRWYSGWCRYPIFENTRITTFTDNDTVTFAMAYYYSPEPPYYHLRQKEDVADGKDTAVYVENIGDVFTEAVFAPNPVYSGLHISYKLTRSASVYFSIHYNGGIMVFKTQERQECEGYHDTTLNMSSCPIGVYVLYVHVDDMILSETIVKM